jgi:HK97 gp10 family phage protein
MAVIRFSGRRQIRIEGLEETRRVFAMLPREATARITHALNLGAEEIKVTAQALAPVVTGELRGAIEVRRDLQGFDARGIIGALQVGAGDDNGRVQRFIGVFPQSRSSPGWYAAFVEFGTSARVKGEKFTTAGGRKKRSGNTHPGTTAKPFLFPAFRALRKRVTSRIARELKRAFKEAAGKKFGKAA